ncbi:hypothetical protein QA600_05140 [Natronococcus sp. A-GB1]|uniref:hypothetical protein n=1 Tax=Natronococcus sp. A-GB1 TaxID=3037648 RepID=UPI00241C97AB|nr:hypothetical protein [Natronococcus sp. A-GB1]MDG5758720.1 hypothetical protein [Natronococcus sp. A-GB1]
MKVPIAIVAVLGLFLLASVASLLAAPLRYLTTAECGGVNDEPAMWTIEMAPEAALTGALGVVGLIVLVHLANAATYVCARICAAPVNEPITDDGSTATPASTFLTVHLGSGGFTPSHAGRRLEGEGVPRIAFDLDRRRCHFPGASSPDPLVPTSELQVAILVRVNYELSCRNTVQ